MMWRFPAVAAFLACTCGGCARTCRPAPVLGEEASGAAPPGDARDARAPDATAAPLRLVGRFAPPSWPASPDGGHASVRFAWSGSTIEARFTGPSITMRLRAERLEGPGGGGPRPPEPTTAYGVWLDDRPRATIEVSAERERYEVASGLDPAASHMVRLVREAEAFGGVHELLGLDLGPGGGFLPPKSRPLRIEIVGDSITCGYGVLGESAACSFSFATERASAAYGARLGELLQADVTTLCWSGRGVFRNYDGSTRGTMPELFELTLPTPPAVPWSFAQAPSSPPEVVILALGTNDFLGGGGKPLDLVAFEDAYVAFARRVRDVYPSAWVFLITSPMLGPAETSAGPGPVEALARTRLERVVARRTQAGDRRIELIPVPNDAPHWGCDGHPDRDMNGRIAERIAPIVRARLHL